MRYHVPEYANYLTGIAPKAPMSNVPPSTGILDATPLY